MVDVLHRQFDWAEQAARRRIDAPAEAVDSADMVANVPVTWVGQLVALAGPVLAAYEEQLRHLEAYARPSWTIPREGAERPISLDAAPFHRFRPLSEIGRQMRRPSPCGTGSTARARWLRWVRPAAFLRCA